ncbi:galactosylgalactosylxylosylprotein 3-beta-glucuronosyltransferase S-like isoform X2 [Ornithodoros turicata]|uniref:galactosylgalactosylxylosylprotein 3-beta-glucuronosyltransferase S-like isoform X2 n=1 Tax=Ornithodoros turicata TaxID=34597 RepID=UPI00313A4BBF
MPFLMKILHSRIFISATQRIRLCPFLQIYGFKGITASACAIFTVGYLFIYLGGATFFTSKPLREGEAQKQYVPVVVYVVTPTYRRATQAPDLTRLMQTLRLANDICWIIVEDSHKYTPLVSSILERSGIPGVHLLGPTASNRKLKKYGRGVSARNRAIQWLRTNATGPGVVYFADDDNSYDVRLFDEIRQTKRISVFPVGTIGEYGVSAPVVISGKVAAFHDSYRGGRKFAVDMAGFAVNLSLLCGNKRAVMPHILGKQEDIFLRSFNVSIGDLEPLCNNCTQVLRQHQVKVAVQFQS